MSNYIPDDDTIEEMIGQKLSEEKKQELARLREEEELEDWKKMMENAETIYLSKKDYDALVERINAPPDPKAIERFKQIMKRKAPWDE